MTKTILKLNKPYENIKSIVDLQLIAPDGFTITHKMKLSNPMKELFSHSGISIINCPIVREVDGRYVEIEGISLEIAAPNELMYRSTNKKEAAKTYRLILKPALESAGYVIDKDKPCTEEVICEKVRGRGTVLTEIE